jgi:ABC-2 type transport system ATP-binding protein
VEAVERVQAQDRANGQAPPEAAELRVRLYVSGEAPMLVAPAAEALAGHGLSIADIKLGAPSLEDVFIHLTGRTLR